jgi:NitT/TauT family transport system permease protein
VRLGGVAPYILPAPSLIVATAIDDWPVLGPSLWVTLTITFAALAAAVAGGVGLALLLDSARWLERGLLPIAVILQVTPIVAIAPILLVWLEPSTAVLVCAFLVAFFPILSNTAMGLAATDHRLLELFQLYRASRWQTLWRLRLPAALPAFLGGLRIAGGLALIGAVVGELAAGRGGARLGSRLPHFRGRLSRQCAAHVRGFAARVARRPRHPCGDARAFASGVAALARQRGRARRVAMRCAHGSYAHETGARMARG